jgi:hypothetical protein
MATMTMITEMATMTTTMMMMIMMMMMTWWWYDDDHCDDDHCDDDDDDDDELITLFRCIVFCIHMAVNIIYFWGCVCCWFCLFLCCFFLFFFFFFFYYKDLVTNVPFFLHIITTMSIPLFGFFFILKQFFCIFTYVFVVSLSYGFY